MRRKKKELEKKARIIFPITKWRQCRICEQEFLLEKAYAIKNILIDIDFDGIKWDYIICKKCAKSKKGALKVREETEQKKQLELERALREPKFRLC